MTIKIEVKSAEIKVHSGNAKATGRPFSIRKQEAWAHTFDREGKQHPYPQRIEVRIPDEMQYGYAPGDYTISPASYYVDRFGDLTMGLVLIPLKAATVRAAA